MQELTEAVQTTVLPVPLEHILPAAIRDHVVPVQIYELTSAAINMLTARLVLQQEAAPLIHARRDIIQNAAEDADNVRQAVPLVTNITAPPANRGTRWDPDLIRAFPITESVHLTAGLRPDQDPTRDPTQAPPPQAVQAAVLLQSDIPASTALKLNVCMKAAPPAPLTR